MNKKVKCFTKDGIEKEPRITEVPVHICSLIHSIALEIKQQKEVDIDNQKLA